MNKKIASIYKKYIDAILEKNNIKNYKKFKNTTKIRTFGV